MNTRSIPLGEVLRVQRRRVDPGPTDTYAMLGIYSHGKGTFRKPAISGASAPQAGLYQVASGDLVLNITFAWEGALAIVSGEDDGRFVSGRFPTFVCDSERCDARFVLYYFRSRHGRQQLVAVSPGSAGRNRVLNIGKFLALPVPMPPLNEQRELVARLTSTSEQVAEAHRCRVQIERNIDALSRSLLNQTSPHSKLDPMHALVRMRHPDVTVEQDRIYNFAGVYSFGRGVFASVRKAGRDFSYARLTTIHTGDFVYPKLMAWEGALGCVPPECDGLVVSPEFPVFDVDQTKVLSEVLDVYFRSPQIWPVVAGISSGTNARRRRMHPSVFLEYQFPVPPKYVQEQVRSVSQRANVIRNEHESTRMALDTIVDVGVEREFAQLSG